MKVQRVQIERFKNIEDLSADLQGKNILLLADNGRGKSSFMQAIQLALGGDVMPPQPIKEGEDSAMISVDVGDEENEYTFRVRFRQGKSPICEVIAPNGVRDVRKSVIGSIAGEIDFNVDEFVRLSSSTAGRRKQVEIFKSMLDEDVIAYIDELNKKVQESFEMRTSINRDIKTLSGFIQQAGLEKDDFIKYGKKIDTEELSKRYDDAVKKNATIQGVQDRFNERAAEILEQESKLKKLKENQTEAAQYLESHKPTDLAPLQEQIKFAEEHNQHAIKVAEYKTKQEELNQKQEQAGDLTVYIDTTKQTIEDAIKDMESPVEDLSFDMESLLYKGLPVDVSSMSTSEIIHLGIQIQIAKNPNVKVLCIEHGESIGQERLEQIQELAEKYEYQIIMEQVERGTEELQIEFMND